MIFSDKENCLCGLRLVTAKQNLRPDKFSDSIEDPTESNFKTLYRYDLSDEETNDLVKDSIPRQASEEATF